MPPKSATPSSTSLGFEATLWAAADTLRNNMDAAEYKHVVLGLVTTKRGELESKDALKRRIEEAARHAPIEQLCLSPQCGFSSTVEGNVLTEDEQWAKLALVVEVAAEIWG